MNEDQRRENMSQLIREVFEAVALAPNEARTFLDQEKMQRERAEPKEVSKREGCDLEK